LFEFAEPPDLKNFAQKQRYCLLLRTGLIPHRLLLDPSFSARYSFCSFLACASANKELFAARSEDGIHAFFPVCALTLPPATVTMD
jgi:hypothetical protein